MALLNSILFMIKSLFICSLILGAFLEGGFYFTEYLLFLINLVVIEFISSHYFCG